MKLCILTSRDIGKKCKEWARQNMPEGFELVDTMNNCDIVISVLYERILPPEYLAGLTRAFNFHPGLLPEYRGSASCSWAIYNNESEVGVTLHEMKSGIDTGGVLDKVAVPIGKYDTAETAFNKVEGIIENMFKSWFLTLLTGEYIVSPQDESKAHTYYKKDLDKLKDVSSIVRALTFQGKESAFYINSRGEKIILNYYAEAK